MAADLARTIAGSFVNPSNSAREPSGRMKLLDQDKTVFYIDITASMSDMLLSRTPRVASRERDVLYWYVRA